MCSSTVLLMHKKTELTVRKKITSLVLSLEYTEDRSESLQPIVATKWSLLQLFHRAHPIDELGSNAAALWPCRSVQLTKGPSA